MLKVLHRSTVGMIRGAPLHAQLSRCLNQIPLSRSDTLLAQNPGLATISRPLTGCTTGGGGVVARLARKIHDNKPGWETGVHNWPTSTSPRISRAGVYFFQSKDPKFLNAVERNYQNCPPTLWAVPGGGFAETRTVGLEYTDLARLRNVRDCRVHAQLPDADEDLSNRSGRIVVRNWRLTRSRPL